jgi:exonuclease SbcC
MVAEGEEEHYFPLHQFSGGERDVFVLCARLALSQLIGGQAKNPPQFVVMDEVFGSLDRERRNNLMDTLQKLVDETGVFKQLFVISHVDDVQASPAFDEIWRVVRLSDGTSRLEQMDSTAMPEDM